MKKILNKDLTAEQMLVLFEDGTEAPGTSELNNEKREGRKLQYFLCTNDRSSRGMCKWKASKSY